MSLQIYGCLVSTTHFKTARDFAAHLSFILAVVSILDFENLLITSMLFLSLNFIICYVLEKLCNFPAMHRSCHAYRLIRLYLLDIAVKSSSKFGEYKIKKYKTKFEELHGFHLNLKCIAIGYQIPSKHLHFQSQQKNIISSLTLYQNAVTVC